LTACQTQSLIKVKQ